MNLKSLLARRFAKTLEQQARLAKRALRDHLRTETARLHDVEVRARGLRLYAAWSRPVRVSAPRLQVLPHPKPEQVFKGASLA